LTGVKEIDRPRRRFLHNLYIVREILCPVFPAAPVSCEGSRRSESAYGYIVLGRIHRAISIGNRIGQGLRRLGAQIGAKKMNAAYLLSGLLALALLIYLLAALIWAEDL